MAPMAKRGLSLSRAVIKKMASGAVFVSALLIHSTCVKPSYYQPSHNGSVILFTHYLSAFSNAPRGQNQQAKSNNSTQPRAQPLYQHGWAQKYAQVEFGCIEIKYQNFNE
jgi:hypothetical protein